ncbi:MFS transporter [Dermatophilus congolensis]|uniref:Putative niacin/nicotinamide transporter NaiP n=1 Tax=Dermatophilus congolensis TaxID=1863 RepID=A0A239VIK8_9MICO|nr:MFS transporter [Dermatophilus congolensis]MBO3129170.1 MFS transporter [Dermatophilus congolensis]MBO3132197.1 MFS transporter [Dermatophilus congolensis]MBO3133647.1 MFS transporter [Dermatophilus congolensis]MBO3135880.1 MFS transporter [Dermatophilus congolensis]MBO3138120.1 MFS transporter [Dermatophilus congolensis]
MSDIAVPSARPTALQQIDSRPLTRNQKSLIGLAITGNISEFFDMFLIGFAVNSLLKDPNWNLNGNEIGIILAMSGLGTVIGAILWGHLADRIGRKVSFFWCVLLFTLFTFISVFTPDNAWIMLAALRVLVGIGVGGLNIVSIPYIQEFVPAKQRGLLSGLASVFIPLGLFLGSLASKMVGDNWRLLIALGAAPIFLLLWLRAVPESPRYLQTQGRTDEARKALAWALEIPVNELGELPTPTHTEAASYSIIFGKYLRPLVIITLGSFSFILGSSVIQSWGQTILGSGYAFDTGMVANLFMLVSLGDLLGRLTSAWLADKIGRRWTMFSFGLIGACGLLIAAISTTTGDSAHAGWIFFTGILIAMTFGDGAFGILNAFGAEQFPNEARSTGLGLGYGIGATAKIFGPALLGAMFGAKVTLDSIAPAFTFFAALLLLGGITYLFATETKGKSLDSI